MLRCGRTSTSVNKETATKVHKLVTYDRRLKVSFVAESVGISTGSVHSNTCRVFVDDKGICKTGISRILSYIQKADRLDTSS